jgi:hypothetical protein
MAHSLIAGDEFRAERGDDRAVVKHRTVKHLECGAGRVLEGDYLFHPADLGLIGGQLLERHPGTVECGFDPVQCRVVAHFPPDVEHPVRLAGHHDQPGRALVHPQVQRQRVRPLAFRKAQDAEGEPPPAVNVIRRNGDIAKAFQIAHRCS